MPNGIPSIFAASCLPDEFTHTRDFERGFLHNFGDFSQVLAVAVF